MEVFSVEKIPAWRTLDGSRIRELVAYRNSSAQFQSLAEATVEPGQQTRLHLHRTSEEIYYILSGTGEVCLGEEREVVTPQTAVLIPAGTPHKIRNTGSVPLVFLCICSPPYEHADTLILE
jgi:mannose-6-phosphate isomerase-like protein (cupin superfamily)